MEAHAPDAVERLTFAGRFLLAAPAVLAFSAAVAAQSPEDLGISPEVRWPISPQSIAAAVIIIGGTLVLLSAGVYVGFRFVRRLVRRIQNSV